MIYRDKTKIEILKHAFVRANQRGIPLDSIEATVKGGTIERFGKNYVRFVKKYKRGTIVCIGEKRDDKIDIFTIEWR